MSTASGFFQGFPIMISNISHTNSGYKISSVASIRIMSDAVPQPLAHLRQRVSGSRVLCWPVLAFPLQHFFLHCLQLLHWNKFVIASMIARRVEKTDNARWMELKTRSSFWFPRLKEAADSPRAMSVASSSVTIQTSRTMSFTRGNANFFNIFNPLDRPWRRIGVIISVGVTRLAGTSPPSFGGGNRRPNGLLHIAEGEQAHAWQQ